jgi:RimJ/RimL family protein N-acetyltransferase
MPFPNPCPLDVPIIETERLKLRGHTIEDASNVVALWSDPEVTRYIGGKPHTAEECWARLLRYVGHWSLLGFGYWVVEEKAAGEFVGEVGFSLQARDRAAAWSRRSRMGTHSIEAWVGLCDRGGKRSVGLGT